MVPHEEVTQDGGRNGGVAGSACAHGSSEQEEEPGILGKQAQEQGEFQKSPTGKGLKDLSEGLRVPGGPCPQESKKRWGFSHLSILPVQVPQITRVPPAGTYSRYQPLNPEMPFPWASPLLTRTVPQDGSCYPIPPPAQLAGMKPQAAAGDAREEDSH